MNAPTPYLYTTWVDPVTGANGWLVLDKVVNGIGDGGTRMRPGLTLGELQRIARTMTFKLNIAKMNAGGAKGGIDYDPSRPDAGEVLKRFYIAHKDLLRHTWITGADLGTREEDIQRVAKEIGLESPIEAIAKQPGGEGRVKAHHDAMELKYRGRYLTSVVTGYGCVSALRSLLRVKMSDISVAVQGFGEVGSSAVMFLAEQGAVIRAVCDINGTIYSDEERGLDANVLLNAKDERGRHIDRSKLPSNYKHAPREDWYKFPVEVLLPAAVADAITLEALPFIDKKVLFIVEGANIPTTAAAEAELFKRGVTVVPDFIANAGMVCIDAATLTFDVPIESAAMFDFVDQKIGEAIRACADLRISRGLTLRQAAEELYA